MRGSTGEQAAPVAAAPAPTRKRACSRDAACAAARTSSAGTADAAQQASTPAAEAPLSCAGASDLAQAHGALDLKYNT